QERALHRPARFDRFGAPAGPGHGQEPGLIVVPILDLLRQNLQAVSPGGATPGDGGAVEVRTAGYLPGGPRGVVEGDRFLVRMLLQEALALGQRDRVREDLSDAVDGGP